jgi:hypothetical protein
MSTDEKITKDNIDKYLKELSKEYKKINPGNNKTRIVIVGGGVVLLKHNFRKTTEDIDATIYSTDDMLEAIDKIAKKYSLSPKWINTDFEESASYSDKLIEVSNIYKEYDNKVEIRLIEREYLIAMKLTAARNYKHDLSDIAGILMEYKNMDNEITMDDINKAVKTLYGNWNRISKETRKTLKEMFDDGDYEKVYNENKKYEEKTRENRSKFGNNNNFIEKLKDNKDGVQILIEEIVNKGRKVNVQINTNPAEKEP